MRVGELSYLEQNSVRSVICNIPNKTNYRMHLKQNSSQLFVFVEQILCFSENLCFSEKLVACLLALLIFSEVFFLFFINSFLLVELHFL